MSSSYMRSTEFYIKQYILSQQERERQALGLTEAKITFTPKNKLLSWYILPNISSKKIFYYFITNIFTAFHKHSIYFDIK